MALLDDLTRLSGALMDFVFPRICCGCEERILETGRLVCEECFAGIPQLKQPICPTCGCEDAEYKGADRCADCPAGEIFFEMARGVVPFAGVAKSIVERLKYHGRQEYSRLMAAHMVRKFGEEFNGVEVQRVVPVPLHRTRQRERGFNQSALLARELGAYLHVPDDEALLRRLVATPSQTRLSRRQRATNIHGAFACPDGSVAGEAILLVDDVYTTGATLNECARVLRTTGGAQVVYGLSFARATLG